MRNWIKKYAGTVVLAGMTGAIGFAAGQVFPVYSQYADSKRAEVSSIISLVATRGDEVEKTIKPLMQVAASAAEPALAPVQALDDSMFALFQTLDTAQKEFPSGEAERRNYVDAMLRLKRAAGDLHGPLDGGKELVEAASVFKRARTDYEQRLALLEPTFFSSLMGNLR